MGHNRGDSFPFDFKSNGIPFDSKSRVDLTITTLYIYMYSTHIYVYIDGH